jgi:integrase
MASIRSRSGRLFVDFRYLGQRCREVTAFTDTPQNRKHLSKLIERMEAEITLGSFEYQRYFPKSSRLEEFQAKKGRQDQVFSKSPCFDDFSRTWFREQQIEWRPSYQEKVSVILDKYLLPYFGSRGVGNIKKSDLLDFRASLAKVKNPKKATGLTTARINQIMTPLRMILNEAAERYEFETPYRNIKNLREEKVDVMPFTLDEVWQVINTVRPEFRNYYTVRFFTGLRTSEIDGLKWENIDLDRREIRVREALVNGNTNGTKTRTSDRVVQMNQPVYKALVEQSSETRQLSTYVFCQSNGKPLDYHNVNRRIWKPTLGRLRLPYRRAYQTRHTAATLWLAAGENPEWIARQLGHANTEMLFRVYSRYVPDVTRKDGSAFEQLILSSKTLVQENS